MALYAGVGLNNEGAIYVAMGCPGKYVISEVLYFCAHGDGARKSKKKIVFVCLGGTRRNGESVARLCTRG